MIMPAKSSPKREREFKQLEQRFQKEHRYPGREEEVAARIVNKQRAQYGETKAERQKDKEGKSPDQGLPIQDYQHMTIAQIAGRLNDLSAADIRKIRTYETKHKNRKGVLEKLDRRLTH
jgi:hypothetical protein